MLLQLRVTLFRLCVIIELLITLGITFLNLFKRWSTVILINSLTVASCSVGVVLLLDPSEEFQTAASPQSCKYLTLTLSILIAWSGALLTIMYPFCLFPLSYWQALLITFFMLIVYNAALVTVHSPTVHYLSFNVFLLAAIAICLGANYQRDQYMRKEFLLRKKIVQAERAILRAQQQVY